MLPMLIRPVIYRMHHSLEPTAVVMIRQLTEDHCVKHAILQRAALDRYCRPGGLMASSLVCKFASCTQICNSVLQAGAFFPPTPDPLTNIHTVLITTAPCRGVQEVMCHSNDVTAGVIVTIPAQTYLDCSG